MKVNDKAPAFSLLDQDGNKVSLKDFAGKTVVLFFYPKADTPGCTVEACGFRDTYKKIQATGTVILGISADTSAKQKKFEEKFKLPYPLLPLLYLPFAARLGPKIYRWVADNRLRAPTCDDGRCAAER